jgi:hypothetical protein
MSLFRRHDERDKRLEAVAEQLTDLDRRLADAQTENNSLQLRLAAIEHRPLPAPAPQPDVNDLATRVRTLLGEPPPPIDPRRVDELEASTERLQLRVAELASVVTNQLGELGGELDAIEHAVTRRLKELEARAEQPSVVDAPHSNGALREDVLDELRGNQVRIANELARFSIAVREEMAALVPRVTPKA